MNEEIVSLWVGRSIEAALTVAFLGWSLDQAATYFLKQTKNFWIVCEYFVQRKRFHEWRKTL